MKANSSEAVNRIVSGRSSRKVVVSIAFAFVMVTGAFLVSSSLLAETTPDVRIWGYSLDGGGPAWVEGDWTTGCVKGYREGDVIPVKLTVDRGSQTVVSFEVLFEYGYGVDETHVVMRGFDSIVTYSWLTGDPPVPDETPEAPYNEPVLPDVENEPFSLDVADGITFTQEYRGIISEGSPSFRIWESFLLTVTFGDEDDSGSPDSDEAALRAGGQLYRTQDGILGASYFPGASLHIRLSDAQPGSGAEDVPIMVDYALVPPVLKLEKFSSPEVVAPSDVMEFELTWENLGQADANVMYVIDFMPAGMSYVVGSGVITSSDATFLPVSVPDPVSVPYYFSETGDPVTVWYWDLSALQLIAKGMGPYDSLGLTWYTLTFSVQVVSGPEGTFENYARIYYEDPVDPTSDEEEPLLYEPDLDPCWAEAVCTFTRVLPGIIVSKTADPACGAGQYLWSDEWGPCGIMYFPGDKIRFTIEVENPSTILTMSFEVYDVLLSKELGLPLDKPIWSGMVAPSTSVQTDWIYVNDVLTYLDYVVKGTEPEPEEWDYKFRNYVSAKAWDCLGHVVWDLNKFVAIEIYHPDLEILKEVDCGVESELWTGLRYMAIEGEEVYYTITIDNPSSDTDMMGMFVKDSFLEDFWYLWPMDDPGTIGTDTFSLPWDAPPLVLTSEDQPLLEYEVDPEDDNRDKYPDDGWIDNVACVYGHDAQGHEIWRGSLVSFEIVEPSITIEKIAVVNPGTPDEEERDYVGLDGVVTYKVTVTNTDHAGDNVPLWFFYYDSLDDMDDPDDNKLEPKDGAVPPDVLSSLDESLIPPEIANQYDHLLWVGYLLPGESDTMYFTYEVEDADITEVVVDEATGETKLMIRNSIYVYGWHNLNHPWAYVSDDDTYDVEPYGEFDGHVFLDVKNFLGGWGTYEGTSGPEHGLNEWKVELFAVQDDDDDGVFEVITDVDDQRYLYRSVMTAYDADHPEQGDGYYRFIDIPPGYYRVKENLPSDAWFPTLPDPDLADANWRDKIWFDGIELVGGNLATLDFGNIQYNYITGFKWLDYDMDESRDSPEPYINNWRIYYQEVDDSNPWEDLTAPDTYYVETGPGTDPTAERINWADGYFYIKVLPGTYKVYEQQRDGWYETTYEYQDNREEITVTDGDPDNDGNLVEHYAICDEFGNIPLVEIEGWKFYDKDRDGVPGHWIDLDQDPDNGAESWVDDPGEVGLDGRTILLEAYLWNGAEWVLAESASTTTPTDPLGVVGNYNFLDGFSTEFDGDPIVLPDGVELVGVFAAKLVLTEDDPDWLITTPLEDRTMYESDAVAHVDACAFTAPIGYEIDLGNMRYAKIVGFKWNDLLDDGDTPNDPTDDTWPNGKIDEGESGLPSWGIYWWADGGEKPDAPQLSTSSIELEDPYPDWVQAALDDEEILPDPMIGWYEIAGLLPGDYVVEEDRLEFSQPTTPTPVTVHVPAWPYGDPIRLRVDFGNVFTEYDPEIPFALNAGWNMWSMPIDVPGLTAKGLLTAIGQSGSIVVRLDEATSTLSPYKLTYPDSLSFPVVHGDGYYIWVRESAYFTLTGDAVGASTVDLVKGWNFVGYSSIHATHASALLGMVSGCGVTYIVGLDESTGLLQAYKIGWSSELDFAIVPGKAYFIYALGPGQLVFGGG